MIAATAIAEDLPLYTTNPGDYAGLEKLVRVVRSRAHPCLRRRIPAGESNRGWRRLETP